MPALVQSAANASPRALLAAVELAEHHAQHRAGLADHAGLGDGGADVGDAAHHRLPAQDRRQPVGGIDAVLQGDHGGVRGNHRLDRLARALDVPQLHAEQHDIDRADGSRIVGRLGRHEMDVAALALELEALALHRLEMRAAGDEGDVGAGLGQRRAIAAADAARSDYCDTHRMLPNTISPALQVATPSMSSILRPPSA